MEPRKDILVCGRVLHSKPFEVGDSYVVERDFPGKGYSIRVERRSEGSMRVYRSPKGAERDLDGTVTPTVFEWGSRIPLISHRLITQ